ncbi:MAG: VOC family protein [Trueperaceae bacterium]|nr:VOC family protein [Trueperaceae bacterium]
MKLEHTALNVPDPKAQANWMVEHLGLKLVRDLGEPTFITFVADNDGALLELYKNPKADIPDYFQISPYTLHLAFTTDDLDTTKAGLLAAGASDTGIAETLPNGDTYVFLHDPWGLSIQLIKRVAPIL